MAAQIERDHPADGGERLDLCFPVMGGGTEAVDQQQRRTIAVDFAMEGDLLKIQAGHAVAKDGIAGVEATPVAGGVKAGVKSCQGEADSDVSRSIDATYLNKT